MSDSYELASQTSMIVSLRNEIKQVRGDVAQLGQMQQSLARLDGLPEQVTHLTVRMTKIEELLAEVREQQMLNASLEQARDERMRLEDRLRDEFAGRKEIRQLAVSLISSAGSAAIRDAVIDPQTVISTAGEHMLKDADYWLAPAVIAVAAEQLGHSETSPGAWSLSATSDLGKSDLFMSLFCSLQRKHDAAAMSMNRYLEALNPHALGREFSHVINALAEGELGPDARSYAQEAMNRWGYQMLSSAAGETSYDTQFTTCRNHLLVNREPLPDQLPNLRHHAAEQWNELEQYWPYVMACRLAARSFAERFPETGPAELLPARRTHSRRALRQLIEQPEEDEIEVRRLIRTQDLIVQCGGDRQRAEALASELGDPFAPTSDLATFLTQATFEPEAYGLGLTAQRFALACATNWIMGAGESITVEAIRHRPTTVAIRWDGWAGQISVEAPEDTETARVTEAICDYVAANRRARRPNWGTILALLVGVLLPVLAIIQLQGDWELILSVLGAAITVATGVEIATYPTRRANAAREAAAEQESVKDTIPKVVAESRALLRLWDSTAKDGLDELATTLKLLGAPRLG
jgi:hypothetical protein